MSTFADDIAAGKHDGKMRAAVVSAFNAGQSATRAVALWAAREAQREIAERCIYMIEHFAEPGDLIAAEFLTTGKEN
jgi:hypothetical protein